MPAPLVADERVNGDFTNNMSNGTVGKTEQIVDTEVPDIENGKKFSVQRFEESFALRLEKSPICQFFKSHPSVLTNLHVGLILVAIFLDPLFFYISVVNKDSNCLGSDNKLRIILVVFRTFVDGVYILLCCHHKLVSFFNKPYQGILYWLAAILAVLQVPQVIVYATSWRLLTVKLLKFLVLTQLVPRVYLLITTYRYARIVSKKSMKTWYAAAFYLLLFILASNILGAFWYLRSIERNMDCWREACKIRGLCGVSSLYCDGNLNNNTYLDEFCPMPPASNSTFFDHGIYLDAFEREIIGSHINFLDKFFYCLWWGLQSLSSLGQNINPGTYIWDNFFAIFIVVTGLVLLALLIGNMQVYLQSEASSDLDSKRMKQAEKKRKQERKRRMKEELVRWPPLKSLPIDLIKQVQTCEDEEWLRTTEINLETLLRNFRPREAQQKIRRELCKKLFSKVKEFQELIPDVQKELRDRAKAVIFEARSTIHTEGQPIYEMIHMVHGRVLAFSRVPGPDTKIQPSKWMHAHNLNSEDSIGKELLDKALESPDPALPLATKTVQALTKVEAFALSVDDFVSVFTRHGYSIPSYRKGWAKNEHGSATTKKVTNMKRTSFHEA